MTFRHWLSLFFHSASFSPGRYAWLSLFWPLVHLIDGWLDLQQPAIAWLLTIHGVGPRGEIIVPVVKVLLRSLNVILRVSGLEEAEAQNTVMSTTKVTCCCCSTQTTASEVFSQKECEGERRFCLFNTNSTAKKNTSTHSHASLTNTICILSLFLERINCHNDTSEAISQTWPSSDVIQQTRAWTRGLTHSSSSHIIDFTLLLGRKCILTVIRRWVTGTKFLPKRPRIDASESKGSE